ncbi:hypothetical protein SELMODRAFT_418832 [Selaginella moellendorffii]|uniref:RING-type domain-containing protein n=1 Tax=Selaginella moellendorffii TaxID=88036 RepID=D8S6I4_SELML|nr:trichohyalin [Selaginella moellendorffii]EFJ20069.1 hypothetical protein SELMODRAFT_418832 [Selaginella moellendorffii]|eukprot:XP_002979112.1 trichohyalin [Selaginella moellendorffii]
MGDLPPIGERDRKIPWPPVVVIENVATTYDRELRKHRGMENREIRAAIEEVIKVEDRRLIPLYNYEGQTSRAFLVFPSTEIGYENAVRVHDAFAPRRESRRNGQLYGYLATPEDMKRLDSKKKALRNWTIESLEEKVLRPRREALQEYERAKQLQIQLQQENDAAESALHNDSQKAALLQQELARKKEEMEKEKRLRREIKEAHEREMKKRRSQLEAQREMVLRSCRRENEELFESLKKKREETDAEIAKYQREEKSLRQNIDSRNKELQKFERLLSEQGLQMKIGERLAALKEEQHRRMMALRTRYNEERLQLAQQKQAKEKQLLEEQLRKKEELAQSIKSDEKNAKNENCIICMEKFSLRRGLYGCGHSYVCEECLPAVWGAKKECPICRHPQKKMPILTHVYS